MSTPTKPKLSREILNNENVFFYKHVHKTKSLPKWLRGIKRQIRHRRIEAPDDSKSKDMFAAEYRTFVEKNPLGKDSPAYNLVLRPKKYRSGKATFGDDEDASLAEIKRTLNDCLRVREEASRLCENREEEQSWVIFLRTEFFRSYGEVHGSDSSDWNKHTFARWELHGDIRWTECQPSKDQRGINSVRTGPKPDLTYSFPIFDPTSKMVKWYRHDESVSNFTIPVLNKLRNRLTGSVISSPQSSLKNWTPKKPDTLGAADLTCFPWAVVEVKTSPWKSDKEEFCYCQAANASTEALLMRERLAEWVENPCKNALVIFSFTCVGPIVRLWFTYRQKDGRVAMRCIFATSLELTWGVLALREVIANMREWVYQWVKPEIVGWISAARRSDEPRFPTTPSSGTQQKPGGLFGGGITITGTTGGGLFGGANQSQPATSGLFGGSTANNTNNNTGGGLFCQKPATGGSSHEPRSKDAKHLEHTQSKASKKFVQKGVDVSSPTSHKSVKVAKTPVTSRRKDKAKEQAHVDDLTTTAYEESTDEEYNGGRVNKRSPPRKYSHGIHCPCPNETCWVSDTDTDVDTNTDTDTDIDNDKHDVDSLLERLDTLQERLGSLSLLGGRKRK